MLVSCIANINKSEYKEQRVRIEHNQITIDYVYQFSFIVTYDKIALAPLLAHFSKQSFRRLQCKIHS